ncbi:MAG: TatD family hydrolase [bacterium]
MFIDTHAHLDFRQYDGDREQVIDRAIKNGLIAIITVGIDLETSLASVDLAEEHEAIFAAVGFHPHEAERLDTVALTKLTALAKHEKVVAIGEIGLDYYRDLAPRAIQKEAFRRQIRLAKRLNLPVVIHIRQAYEDAMDILDEERASEVGGVFHCFSGDEFAAMWATEEGFFLSFTGAVTFARSRALRIASSVTADALLLETDSPFLAPVPYRGKRNEPAYLRKIAEKLAEARRTTVEKIADSTTLNAKNLFRLNV